MRAPELTAVGNDARTPSAYVDAALERELAAVRGAGEGGRAAATFRAAAALGSLVGGRALAEDETRELLVNAAVATGLAEREARGHVLRGLRIGAATPRELPLLAPDEGTPRRSAASIRGSARPDPPAPTYPPVAEVAALWAASSDVSTDPACSAWLRSRGLDPCAVATWDLARALPRDAQLPVWARFGRRTWREAGHRLLVPLRDASGALRSLRARRVVDASSLKSLATSGFQERGLVLACPLAVQVLRSAPLPWWKSWLVIVEGEPDWLTWAAAQSEGNEQGPAVLGIRAGAWTPAFAARVPDGATVTLATHDDPAGDAYALAVAQTLAGRCVQLRRQRPGRAS